MAFMQPIANYLTKEEAREYIEVEEWDEDPEAGWYARLSAPGYMDCTEWTGPFPRAWRALRAVCEFYEVDVHGDERGER